MWEQRVHHQFAVTRLLDVGDLASAAIGDAGLCAILLESVVLSLWMSSGRTPQRTADDVSAFALRATADGSLIRPANFGKLR
jgi:hypothetical protein